METAYASNVINIGLLIVAMLSTVVAGFAARDARRSKDESAAHEAAALAASQRLAAAGDRTADATTSLSASGDRSATALERMSSVGPPWEIARMPYEGHYRLVNNSPTAVVVYKAEVRTEDVEWFEPKNWDPTKAARWEPGQWEEFEDKSDGLMVGPGYLILLVTWRWWDDPDEIPDRVWKGIVRSK